MGIHSFPQRFGVAAALYGSIACHVTMVALLVAVIRLENLGWIAMAGLALMAALLAYEHWIVRPSDLSRLNAAFFNVNGYISLLFFLSWGADLLIH
jgi:4-hydroxybenzoate polyprenyltransferase